MAWNRFHLFLAVLMVVTGSLNTLTTKWTDKIESVGRDGGKPRPFSHPFVQACIMFIGEFLCLMVFKSVFKVLERRNDGSEDQATLTKGNRQFSPFYLCPPAMLDMIATSTMYIGLNLTYASSFQMLRGSVIVFVAVLSMLFLGRRLVFREWFGIGFIIIGLGLVGAADLMQTDDNVSTKGVIIGDILIILAQIITATQMVVEEKFVAGLDIPSLQAVGWEGVFGFSVLSLLLIPMYFIPVPETFSSNPRMVVEDPIDAFYQIKNNLLLIAPIMGTVFSIAFFNYAGISVTKEISATTRMVLDSIRTMVIWAVSLALGWQKFHSLQLIGFASLLFGMCLYNNIITGLLHKISGTCMRLCRRDGQESEPIINQEADN